MPVAGYVCEEIARESYLRLNGAVMTCESGSKLARNTGERNQMIFLMGRNKMRCNFILEYQGISRYKDLKLSECVQFVKASIPMKST